MQTRIDTPTGPDRPRGGTCRDAGVAWAQAGGGVTAVQVGVDDGPWQQATLGPDLGPCTGGSGGCDGPPTPGHHVLTARAVDGAGGADREGGGPGAIGRDGMALGHRVGLTASPQGPAAWRSGGACGVAVDPRVDARPLGEQPARRCPRGHWGWWHGHRHQRSTSRLSIGSSRQMSEIVVRCSRARCGRRAARRRPGSGQATRDPAGTGRGTWVHSARTAIWSRPSAPGAGRSRARGGTR